MVYVFFFFLSKNLAYEKKSMSHRVQVGFKVQLMQRPDDWVGGLRSKLAQSLRPKDPNKRALRPLDPKIPRIWVL